MDARTRKHITIAPCYSTSPDKLRRRFTRLSSNRRSEEEMEGVPLSMPEGVTWVMPQGVRRGEEGEESF
ncbi:Coronatine-insensitive protein 1 [Acorus calamus]|uniref:Coronatine-insensitive protein 1 n=1 Tax=Acorus calamus TaxID=4465 RepID=A0AAV9C5Q0_ACOCL|nr:Coronatine-insensitive protein 1 [Acorus calamus]